MNDTKEENRILEKINDCSKKCIELEVGCPNEDCKHWMNHEGDNNCDLIAIQRNGPMTLRQISERLGVSFVRIKQIEDNAINKIKKGMKSLED